METSNKQMLCLIKKLILSISVTFLSISCDYSIEEEPKLTEMESLILNKWQYDSILVNGVIVPRVGWAFEPNIPRGGGWVPWFWFKYNIDKSYEFRSDVVFRYHLGYKENYQPEYGYWQLDETQDLLIHNKGLATETTYRIIQLNDTLFIREYDRLVYESSNTILWPIGEMATYREFLEKRKEP